MRFTNISIVTVSELALFTKIGIKRIISSNKNPPQNTFNKIGPDRGKKAPSFIVENQDGKRISLADSQGMRRLIAFVSPNCPVCHKALQALYEVLQKRQDLVALVIGSPNHQANQDYIDKHNLPLVILTPLDDSVYELYGIQAFPILFIVDELGFIREKGVVNRNEHLEALLTMAFGNTEKSPL
ncbi:MAG TPA: redoxin domain-containing protein [Ktedonobacteraceae bacterium]|nr:redoxin domain-containing protein [Ktedonobacteraceae bacterium]